MWHSHQWRNKTNDSWPLCKIYRYGFYLLVGKGELPHWESERECAQCLFPHSHLQTRAFLLSALSTQHPSQLSPYPHTDPECYIQTSSTLPWCPNPSGGQPILNQGNHANGNPLAGNWLHGLGFSQSVPCITLQLRTSQFLVSTLFKSRREDALAVEPGLSHKPQSSFLNLPSVGITIMTS